LNEFKPEHGAREGYNWCEVAVEGAEEPAEAAEAADCFRIFHSLLVD
jgi:hypothetical protein